MSLRGMKRIHIVDISVCCLLPACCIFALSCLSPWDGGIKPSLLAMALSVLTLKYYFKTLVHLLPGGTMNIRRLLIFANWHWFRPAS